jgi:hypothetical protein
MHDKDRGPFVSTESEPRRWSRLGFAALVTVGAMSFASGSAANDAPDYLMPDAQVMSGMVMEQAGALGLAEGSKAMHRDVTSDDKNHFATNFDNVEVIRVMPRAHMEVAPSKTYVQKAIVIANNALVRSLNGKIHFDKIKYADTVLAPSGVLANTSHIINKTPEGTNLAWGRCYTETDKSKIENKYGSDFTTERMVIFNKYPLCGDAGRSADGSADLSHPYAFYSNFDPHIALHEEGHRLGLGHAKTVTCEPRAKSVAELAAQATRIMTNGAAGWDTALRVMHDKCTTNEYGDVLSDMGNKDGKNQAERRPYNFAEENRLNPVTTRLKDVDLSSIAPMHQKKYDMSFTNGNLRGIRIALPANHPLRKIDKYMNFLEIGIDQSTPGGPPFIRVLGVSDHPNKMMTTYVIPSYDPRADYYAKFTMLGRAYKDSRLGIEVDFMTNADESSIYVLKTA